MAQRFGFDFRDFQPLIAVPQGMAWAARGIGS